ncbi:GntR family transcriptional regulator [Verticiella sediminum]|uniref:GntR family transcriptional regulator n=1 Tax=Verticiella sediminum TaxID=1247510 RepID=A0A556AXK4_9BURK|nr:GntR family transcriptional regulator [Verticiella sediminum]TSH97669.1 GntR family transcriptional regulator [Verticiella sediminum]
MKHTLTPMTRQNITAGIYAEIKRRLMTGGLVPGEVLTLRSISEMLGVSQTPVREALLQLVSERMLAMTPGKSVHVPVLDRGRLQDLRDIRLNLEALATERAVPRITPEEVRQLEALHARMAQAKAAEDMEGTLGANYEFHFAVYRAARMPDLVAIIEGLWAQTGPSLTYLYRRPFVHLEGPHPHLALIDALRRADTPAAVAAIRTDVGGYGAAMMARLPVGAQDAAA